MNKFLIRAAMLAVACGLSTTASAALITFNFGAEPTSGLTSAKYFSEGGVNLTVRPKLESGYSTSNLGLGLVSGYGLYVCSEYRCDGDEYQSDQYPVDGYGASEGVRFDFSKDVTLVKAEFFVYSDDRYTDNKFDLDVESTKDVINDLSLFSSTCNAQGTKSYGSGEIRVCDFTKLSVSPHSLANANQYTFWAEWKKSAFKIRSLTVKIGGGYQVPEPTTLALLGASLLGFGVTRLRRSRRS